MLILTQRPAALRTFHRPAAPAVKAGTPPFASASIKKQIRAQVLAAPALRHYQYGGKLYTLADVTVNQVVYTAKDDNFTLSYNCVWLPAMPHGGPQGGYCTLTNDGYGQYEGTAATVNPTGADIPSGDIELE